MANKNRFFRKIINGDRAQTQLQTNIEQAVADVIKTPLLNGRLISNVALTVGETKIEHKLGRIPTGYLIIKKSTSATVYDNLSTEVRADLYLPLVASADCLVSVWVF